MRSQIEIEQREQERECLHRRHGAVGGFYTGESYIASLQRLRSSAAMEIAAKVGAFFWSDARKTKVWLCQQCAVEAGLWHDDVQQPSAR